MRLPFMKSLFLRPSPHLVFKWRSDHLGSAVVKTAQRAEMTPCHFFQNTQPTPTSATGFATPVASRLNSSPPSSAPPAGASSHRPERQGRARRAADRVGRMDRRSAGADRSGIAAMAGPPSRLRRWRMALRAVAPARTAGLAGSANRNPSRRPGAGDPERVRRGAARQRAVEPDQRSRGAAGREPALRAGLQRQFRGKVRNPGCSGAKEAVIPGRCEASSYGAQLRT